MRAILFWIPLVLLGLWGTETLPNAWATSFYERPFGETVQDAPVIVRGKVTTTFTDWGRGDDGNKRIYTFWEFQPQEVLKGAGITPNQVLRMREMGGEKDGVGMQVAGSAHFVPGEDVVVFLSEKNTEGSHDIWGMMMGKYNLKKDKNGTEYLVGAGINSLTAPRISDGEEGQDDPKNAKKWTLEALRQLISSSSTTPSEPKIRPSNHAVPLNSRIANTPPPPVVQSKPTPAPQLQHSHDEDSVLSSVLGWGGGIALAGLIMVLLARRRK
ncbi:hypothetical protein WDW37_07930 [Bdellovibrionota bacterium FG-1]